MIKSEFKKYILKPSVLICCAIFIAINFVKFYEIYYYLNGGRTNLNFDYLPKGQSEIHALYGGEITDEKIAALKADRAEADVKLGKYGYVEEPIDGTYSGYPSMDTVLLDEKIEDYRYAVLYSNTSHEIREKALENIEFYTDKCEYDKRENELMAKLYGGRSVNVCVKQSGWNAFFDYKFSVLLCMFLIALTVSPMVSNETESGFYRIINASGRRRTVLGAKIAAAGIFTLALCGVFLVSDLIFTQIIYRADGLSAPLYALKCYELCPFDMSILGGIFLNFAARAVFLLCYTFLVLLVSSLCKSNVISTVLSMCAGFALVIAAEFLPTNISPTALVGLHDEFSTFKTVNVFGAPVLSIYAAFALTIIPCLFLAALIFAFGLRGDASLKVVKRNAF